MENKITISFDDYDLNAELASGLRNANVEFTPRMFVRDGADGSSQVVAIILESIAIASLITALGKIAVANLKRQRVTLTLPDGTSVTAKNKREAMQILAELEAHQKMKSKKKK